jgi:hypothetical protein
LEVLELSQREKITIIINAKNERPEGQTIKPSMGLEVGRGTEGDI